MAYPYNKVNELEAALAAHKALIEGHKKDFANTAAAFAERRVYPPGYTRGFDHNGVKMILDIHPKGKKFNFEVTPRVRDQIATWWAENKAKYDSWMESAKETRERDLAKLAELEAALEAAKAEEKIFVPEEVPEKAPHTALMEALFNAGYVPARGEDGGDDGHPMPRPLPRTTTLYPALEAELAEINRIGEGLYPIIKDQLERSAEKHKVFGWDSPSITAGKITGMLVDPGNSLTIDEKRQLLVDEELLRDLMKEAIMVILKETREEMFEAELWADAADDEEATKQAENLAKLKRMFAPTNGRSYASVVARA